MGDLSFTLFARRKLFIQTVLKFKSEIMCVITYLVFLTVIKRIKSGKTDIC